MEFLFAKTSVFRGFPLALLLVLRSHFGKSFMLEYLLLQWLLYATKKCKAFQLHAIEGFRGEEI
jgi:hypothetical protein